MEMVENLYKHSKVYGNNMKMVGNLLKLYGNYMETIWKLYGKDVERMWKQYGNEMEMEFSFCFQIYHPFVSLLFNIRFSLNFHINHNCITKLHLTFCQSHSHSDDHHRVPP
jgi:hypothetical protein